MLVGENVSTDFDAVALLSVSEESARGATISKGRSRKATFVGVVDYRRAEPPIAIASDKTDKDRRTHYGNPTTNGGCMKDEVSERAASTHRFMCTIRAMNNATTRHGRPHNANFHMHSMHMRVSVMHVPSPLV